MSRLLKQFFTWWNGNSWGTRLFTWRAGRFVGEDEFGNRYFEGPAHKDGYPQRWVIYQDESDPSLIPPGWHGWIHHRVDIPPTEEVYIPRSWERPHLPNLTLTKYAYRPKGSISRGGERPKVRGDYQAWSPDDSAKIDAS